MDTPFLPPVPRDVPIDLYRGTRRNLPSTSRSRLSSSRRDHHLEPSSGLVPSEHSAEIWREPAMNQRFGGKLRCCTTQIWRETVCHQTLPYLACPSPLAPCNFSDYSSSQSQPYGTPTPPTRPSPQPLLMITVNMPSSHRVARRRLQFCDDDGARAIIIIMVATQQPSLGGNCFARRGVLK